MEEAKAAAYYDELTRKGEGAARFKQGLGFSTTSATDSGSAVPSRGSALPSSASFLNNFVRASSPTKAAEIQKHAQIEAIQNKLKKKPSPSENQTSKVPNDRRRDDAETNVGRERRGRRSSSRERDRHSKRRTRSRSRSRSRDDILIGSRRANRSSSRDKDKERDKDRDRNRDRFKARDVERRRRRSRSRSASDDDRARRRGRGKSRSRSSSPRDKRPENSNRGDGSRHKGAGKVGKERNGGIDYSRLIEGYDTMSPAERVKAKMKLQLSETAEKDETKGMGSGWERFEFNKDAPLDDEEAEAAEDDAVLVKHIGQSFRFSAVEARREEGLKAAHDNAMFGASSIPSSINADDEVEGDSNEIAPTTSLVSGDSNDIAPTTSLISDKVLAMQQGSWRNRARRL